MTALIHTCCTLVVALVGEPSGALLLASETSEMATSGTVMRVAETVTSAVIVAATHPQSASVGCTVTAIFKVGITCPSGVIGVLVTEP